MAEAVVQVEQETRPELPPDALAHLLEVERLLNEVLKVLAREGRPPQLGVDTTNVEFSRVHAVLSEVEKVLYPVATRSWHTTARVRMRRDYSCASVDPYLTAHFRAGQELELIQWGGAGQLVERKRWWTSYDIDGAFIVPPTLSRSWRSWSTSAPSRTSRDIAA